MVWKITPRYIVTEPNGDYQQQCNVAVDFKPQKNGQCSNVCCDATRPEKIQQWTSKALTQLWSVDFKNYRSQLIDVSRYFTRIGWAHYQKALTDSGDLKAVKVTCDQATSSRCSGIITPVFSGDADTVTVLKPESMGVIDGRQTWRMLVAFNLFYDYGPGGSFSQNYYATVYVVRAPVQDHPSRLAIAMIHGQPIT